MESSAVAERIKRIIIKQINPELQLNDLTETTPLIGKGLGLDSVSLLELVVSIEADFGMRFDEKEMTPELLANVGSIAAYVQRKSNGG